VLEALPEQRPERLIVHIGPRDADDGKARRQAMRACKVQDGRQEFAAAEIAGRTEDDEDGRTGGGLESETVTQRVGGHGSIVVRGAPECLRCLAPRGARTPAQLLNCRRCDRSALFSSSLLAPCQVSG